jgi:hypothetical protein
MEIIDTGVSRQNFKVLQPDHGQKFTSSESSGELLNQLGLDLRKQ